jgi:hypothetical protein
VILFLSLAALALSRLSSGAMQLLEVSRGQARAYAAARSGVFYMQDLFMHSRLSGRDTLFQSGIDLKGRMPETLFRGIRVGTGTHFDISFKAKGYSADDSDIPVFGCEDEERRLNINAIDAGNAVVLSALLQTQGVDPSTAGKIASGVAAWVSPLPEATMAGNNAGGVDARMGKHRPFDVPEEILAIDGMSSEIFGKIRDYITVFPGTGELKVNLAAASRPVLSALTGRWHRDDPVVDQLIRQRNGSDGIPFTPDDVLTGGVTFDAADLQEAGIFGYNTAGRSQYFRVYVTGVDEPSGAVSAVEAVLDASIDGKKPRVVSWRRK